MQSANTHRNYPQEQKPRLNTATTHHRLLVSGPSPSRTGTHSLLTSDPSSARAIRSRSKINSISNPILRAVSKNPATIARPVWNPATTQTLPPGARNHCIVRARFSCCERIQKQSAAMIRVQVPLCFWEKWSVRLPHSCGWIETAEVYEDEGRLRRLWSMLKVMAPERAGEEGWSVAATVDALDRAQIREGRAAPDQWNTY